MNSLYTEATHIVRNGLAFSGPEMWIVLLVVALLLFGGKKIPELMRGVGKGVGELQKGLEEGKRGLNTSPETTVTPIAVQPALETEPRTETPPAPKA